MNDNHPHDLERLYLVLTPTDAFNPADDVGELWARSAFRIRSVIANAHDGSIPPNEYNARDDESLVPPLTILVERGSHAMAPDLNHDGRFTPGVDSTSRWKLQWGIRDRGSTWGRYRASFMDGRDASALRLCGPDAQPLAEPCSRYLLYPANDLQSWFRALELTDRDRHDVLGRTSWLYRTFGDVEIENLMVPTDPPDGRVLDAMMGRRRPTQASLSDSSRRACASIHQADVTSGPSSRYAPTSPRRRSVFERPTSSKRRRVSLASMRSRTFSAAPAGSQRACD